MSLNTPVAFFVYNRPSLTERVFKRISLSQPKTLFIIADGPKKGDSEDFQLCQKTRQIVERIDWNCDIHKYYSHVNMGCNNRIISGLNLLFQQVDRAIILEDDCIPDLSFFKFCEELLNYYDNDLRIMMITGNNPLGEWKEEFASYHFSNFGGVWGWATWKRAWDLFEVSKNLWKKPNSRDCITNVLVDEKHAQHRLTKCSESINSRVGTWDYVWSFARILNSGLTIFPSKNLISNIGFSIKATHTTNVYSSRANESIYSIKFPLIHPIGVYPDRQYDTLKFEVTHPI